MNGPAPINIKRAIGAALVLCCLAMGGCLERTISITTQPEGALVWLNDVEVGRTPVEVDFTFYGAFDVHIEREGFEPILAKKKAEVPITDQPVIDLFAEAMPFRIRNRLEWHWDLTPLPERTNAAAEQKSLVERAKGMRGQVGRPFEDDQPSGAAGTPTTTEPSGTSRTTTAPAPTKQP